MGIAPYKSFTFDGVSSLNYGVYLTGTGVFNAPARAVEMVEIPGRNGNFALDKGRFENIQVTYKAGMFDVNESNFADKISALRNWLGSKTGYVRLEDDYNASEYRMAVYSSGLEVEHEMLIAGEFEITFDCKPQRFLTSGETASTVTSGATVTNPTLFESSPKLEVTGYGTINLGTEEIEIEANLIGPTIVANNPNAAGNVNIDTTYANSGDRIYGDEYLGLAYVTASCTSSITSVSISTATDWVATANKTSSTSIQATVKYVGDFNYGTSETATNTFTISAVVGGSTKTFTLTANVIYNGSNNIKINSTVGTMPTGWTKGVEPVRIGNVIWLDSTKSTLIPPIYIDCEIGEAYVINNGVVQSINNSVTMPGNLPKLASGSTTVTFDNTITQLKIAPRWWKV